MSCAVKSFDSCTGCNGCAMMRDAMPEDIPGLKLAHEVARQHLTARVLEGIPLTSPGALMLSVIMDELQNMIFDAEKYSQEVE